MTWTSTLRCLGGALVAAMLVSLPACDDGKGSAPSKDDAKAAKADDAKKDEGDAKKDEPEAKDDAKKAATPTIGKPGAKPAADKGATAKADDTAKGDDAADKGGTKKSLTGDDKKGDDKAAAQPPTTGKRGEGNDVGGDCPCRRGLRCCSGKCAASC